MATPLKKPLNLLASYGFGAALLMLLLVLVFLGTLQQTQHGIFEVQKRYFESLVVVHWLGPAPLPLPGAYLLLGLLFVNILLGGIMRAPKSWRRPGMLIAHGGILFLVVAGFVTYHFSTNGHMTLYEGEQSNEYQSFYEWEIIIAELDGEGREFVIPERDFDHLWGRRSGIFHAAEIPFDLEVRGFQRNCTPRPAPDGLGNAVDGVTLAALPKDPTSERNIAGAYATVRPRYGGAPVDGVLWGLARAPWTVQTGGRTYAIDLRHRRWRVPFTITLDQFIRELHPRTGIPASFMSIVTLTQHGASRKVEIKMNEPLRHEGYTFFQASWGPQNAGPNTPLFSQFAVVNNPADQWPLYSCVVVTIGLLIHFTQRLLRHLRAEQRRRNP